jgi:SAM-dependent methyltransferase
MPVPDVLLEILADPADKAPLVWNEAAALFYSPTSGRAYRLNRGVPVLIAEEAVAMTAANVGAIDDRGYVAPAAAEARQRSQFEGLAAWYDRIMSDPEDRGGLLASATRELVELIGSGTGAALDVGCGTGLLAGELRRLGYTPVGVDLSEDQLRVAAERLAVVQGNAVALPFRSGSIGIAYSSFISSAWERQAESVAEVFRVLRSGGRYVDVGVHPCFNGGYADPKQDGTIVQKPGYRESGFRDPRAFTGTVRSRVGAWHRPLAAVVGAFLDAGFRLEKLIEGGPDPLPTVLGISAVKP